MKYFFGLIFLSWLLIYFFLRGPGGTKTLEAMRNAQAEMDAASTIEEKKIAARKVLELIEKDSLAGSVVDKARRAAEAVLA